MSRFTKNMFILTDVDVRDAPDEIVVVPAGMVESTKGNFIVNAASFKAINEYFQQRGLDIVIDYEHQTLNGGEAPAGGWIKSLRWEDGIGVMGQVEWTDKAKGYLANREYRYLSPVVLVRQSDNLAIRLHSVALTNTPAITGMTAIINSDNLDELLERMDFEMGLLQALIELLGLPADTSEETIIQAIKDLKGEMDGVLVANSELKTLLALADTATIEDVKGTIIALKNPTGVVSEAEFLALKQKVDAQSAEALVEAALNAGKLLPAQKKWAIEYALSNKPGFDNFLAQAPQVVPMGPDNPPPREKTTVLSETEMKVCKDLGLTAEEYLKSKNEEV